MSKETNTEKFFTQPKSPKKSDVNRHARDSEDNKTTLSRCKHLNVIKELIEQFVKNFSILASKNKKGGNCKAPHKEEILKNGVL